MSLLSRELAIATHLQPREPAEHIRDVAGAPTPPRRSAGGRTDRLAYLLVAPAVVTLGCFILAPAALVMFLSLFHWSILDLRLSFEGLGNYHQLLEDSQWWHSVRQTALFACISVPLGLGTGLFVAQLLRRNIRGRGLIQVAILSPYIMPGVATIVIWQWIFNSQYGLLDAVLAAVHLPRINWLGSQSAVIPAMVIYYVWQMSGFCAVVYLAALAQIPAEIPDAARIDGAGDRSIFWRVIWPLLSPTTYFLLLISAIDALKVFSIPYVLTTGTGGPNQSAVTIGFYLYQEAFVYLNGGYSAAISTAFLVFILLATAFLSRLTSRRVFYR